MAKDLVDICAHQRESKMAPDPLRSRILKALELQPMTADQLARCLMARIASVRRWMWELAQVGEITPKGKRKGREGHPYIIWGKYDAT